MTTSAKSPFSKPLVVQMTNDGTAAVAVPATRVTATGRRDTVRAIENMRANTPKQHNSATSFGYSTRSGCPEPRAVVEQMKRASNREDRNPDRIRKALHGN